MILRSFKAPTNDLTLYKEPVIEQSAIKRENKSNIENIIDPKKTIVATEKKYTIQAAEYADEDAANRFINALRKQGYEVLVDTIYRDGNKNRAYFKVNVGAFETFNQAKEFNELFMKATNIKDSFIKELN